MTVPGAVYTDKNHTKISCEYTTKKRWLRAYLVMRAIGTVYADKHHTKISGKYTAKKRWLRGLLSHACT